MKCFSLLFVLLSFSAFADCRSLRDDLVELKQTNITRESITQFPQGVTSAMNFVQIMASQIPGVHKHWENISVMANNRIQVHVEIERAKNTFRVSNDSIQFITSSRDRILNAGEEIYNDLCKQ